MRLYSVELQERWADPNALQSITLALALDVPRGTNEFAFSVTELLSCASQAIGCDLPVSPQGVARQLIGAPLQPGDPPGDNGYVMLYSHNVLLTLRLNPDTHDASWPGLVHSRLWAEGTRVHGYLRNVGPNHRLPPVLELDITGPPDRPPIYRSQPVRDAPTIRVIRQLAWHLAETFGAQATLGFVAP